MPETVKELGVCSFVGDFQRPSKSFKFRVRARFAAHLIMFPGTFNRFRLFVLFIRNTHRFAPCAECVSALLPCCLWCACVAFESMRRASKQLFAYCTCSFENLDLKLIFMTLKLCYYRFLCRLWSACAGSCCCSLPTVSNSRALSCHSRIARSIFVLRDHFLA